LSNFSYFYVAICVIVRYGGLSFMKLEVIAKENDFFQAELYKNSQTVIERKKNVLYYDCTSKIFKK